eukprot:c3960_g1_i1.p1 GENE.c3960_g1_i1~~c3960_g1_i1.p1  ORF type:complete len:434 (+),score=116.29 c3960_g1_i1:89-1303(+)
MFSQVPAQPADPLFGINDAYNQDTNPNKLNLGVGAYRDAAGKPWVLPVVREVERKLLEEQKFDKEYLPIAGLPLFTEHARKLLLGEDSRAIAENRVTTFQTLSGTGALGLGMTFIKRFYPGATAVYSTKPSWANHKNIVEGAGLEYKEFRYYDAKTRGLDFAGMIEDMQAAPEGSVFLLHVCAHNPTGVDLSPAQWDEVLKVMTARKHFPFLDCAYQGFATGDIARDAYSVRLFDKAGSEFLVCQSFAKNFGLYGERAGTLSIVCDSPQSTKNVASQVSKIVRQQYSNPPRHGAEIVGTALASPEHFESWVQSLKIMSGRIIEMREILYKELLANETPGTWNHIVDQTGMFSYTGLTKNQVLRLTEQHHVYLTSDGRISMAGLNADKCKYLAQAIKEVVLAVPE